MKIIALLLVLSMTGCSVQYPGDWEDYKSAGKQFLGCMDRIADSMARIAKSLERNCEVMT
jgi:hypothetical protein